jgi:LDH2 family malate/lactate/ureidoglycolate dehydrogenase
VANEQNLKPFTEDQNREEAVKNGRKGGKASGVARRRKADLRRMAQDILDGTYTDKNGKPFTGAELIQNGLLANLGNPNSKNWGKAMDIFIQLTGANMSPEQKAKLKAETQLAKAKAKAADPKQAVSTVNDNFLEALNATAEEDDWSDNDDG